VCELIEPLFSVVTASARYFYTATHTATFTLKKLKMGSIGNDVPRQNFSLDGKIALVTGSGRGIGASIAIALARNGAKVVVNYSRASGPAEKVVQGIKSFGGDAIAIQGDVSDVKQTVRLFDEAVKHYGQLDIAVSNAGVVSFGHLGEVTEVILP
jgi:FlaA1/EpsC-like NDP-sugar epimerase